MKSKIYKIILLLLLIYPLYKSQVNDNYNVSVIVEIAKEDIFTQEGDYFVLFYQEGCLSCENAIYYINIVLNELDYDVYCVKILRLFSDDLGNKSNVGVKDFLSLSISKVPYLILIEKGIITSEVVGFNNIRYYLDLSKRE